MIPAPISAGLLLSYKCNSRCRHCLYACSPQWKADWLSVADAEDILGQLAPKMQAASGINAGIGVNQGLHFTGGEPFLNFSLLVEVVAVAHWLGIRSTFVETNCYWCTDDQTTLDKLSQLKQAGLKGMLISANPFVLEHVPFERTLRAVQIGGQVFPRGVMVYQPFFYQQFCDLGLHGTLSLEEYLRKAPDGLQHAELLPGGRVSYALAPLFRTYPAECFSDTSCQRELIRDWHVHVDNYGNYVPGYCAGLALGDVHDLRTMCEEGLDLDARPVLSALLTSMAALRRLAKANGYVEKEGYVSKCHLCIDIRRHLAHVGSFVELKPLEFYDRLDD